MLTAALALAGALVLASVAHGALNSQLDFSVCPNITTATYFGAFSSPPGCGPGVLSPGGVIIRPDNTCGPESSLTDLGTFLSSQNPLGVFAHVSARNNCPPENPLGPGGSGAFTVGVVHMGFCPAALTVTSPNGRLDGIAVPIGSLSAGSYRVTVTFPDQGSWLQSQASGTLHVGGSFTETSALASPGKNGTFAALLQNSLAGPGAGDLQWTKTGSAAELKGTEYYACGMINLRATLHFGKRSRLSGSGALMGGSGNYEGIKGTFTVAGTYRLKTGRGTLALKGTVTY